MNLEQIKDLAKNDALTACRESGSTETPCGGWESWLVEGLGHTKVCELFGEDPEESNEEWSDSMAAKLTAYAEAAEEAAQSIEA